MLVIQAWLSGEGQYDKKLGFESKIEKLKTEVNKLWRQELQLLGDITAIPMLATGVVKLLNLHHENSKTSIEEIELLIDQVQKCGGINSAITKLSQSEQQHKKERHDVETRDEALLSVDYQANKNSSNEKMEKEDEEPLIAAIGQDNNHDEHTEAQLEIFVNKIIADRSSSSKTKIEEPK